MNLFLCVSVYWHHVSNFLILCLFHGYVVSYRFSKNSLEKRENKADV